MQKIAFITPLVAASLLASAAIAADLPGRRQAPAAAPVAYASPTYNWTGAYAGVNVGVGTDNFTKGGKRLLKKDTSAVGGGTVGYNYQINQFVVGAEADLDATGLEGKRNPFPGATTKAKINSLASVRARVGYAADRALVYATGGYAGGDVKTKINDTTNGVFTSQDSWRNGYVVGGGIEYAFTDKISGKAEYTYTELEKKNTFAGVDQTKVGVEISQVKAGVNYHF